MSIHGAIDQRVREMVAAALGETANALAALEARVLELEQRLSDPEVQVGVREPAQYAKDGFIAGSRAVNATGEPEHVVRPDEPAPEPLPDGPDKPVQSAPRRRGPRKTTAPEA